ncbi:MAG: hypothetical protein A2687_06125 [Candidatus Levybacteria bacterium RIFCSPHIGHO2_01_FULL_38_26]|nr:MAG: hypothetical protein A2687_06125 [Candidatus Levybacteria bacterium RIFCSPHIGHO2_01_FULL_38_26]
MLKKSDPHSSAKAIIAFLIIVVALVILVIFQQNRYNIIEAGSFQPFIFLAFLGSALLLTLLFLVNNSGIGATKKSKSRKKRR